MKALILAAALLTLTPTVLPAQDAARGERGQSPRRVEAPPSDQPASETRDELARLLTQQYPPTLASVLQLDPTLLNNREYLALYPGLLTFLERHPEIARNPGYFLGNLRGGPRGYYVEPLRDTRWQVADAMQNMFGAFLFLLGFSLVVITIGTGVKSFIEHRRWLRVSKIQTETHSKLLDRLTSNEELLAYIQSPAGRQILEAAPLPISSRQAISAPVNRIMWSVQAGVVLALAGAGLWYSRGLVIEEMSQPLAVFGVVSVFLGVGFVLSALVAYGLSKALGLFEPPAMRPHA